MDLDICKLKSYYFESMEYRFWIPWQNEANEKLP